MAAVRVTRRLRWHRVLRRRRTSVVFFKIKHNKGVLPRSDGPITVRLLKSMLFWTNDAKRNELKRRFACIRSTAKREEAMSIAFASCMNSRPARDDVIARTKR